MVVQMPGDGDCLFSALLHQLRGVQLEAPDHEQQVLELRREVVAYIRQQLQLDDLHRFDEWTLSIQNSIDQDMGHNLPAVLDGEYHDLDQRQEQFLTQLEDGRAWGGAETLRAVAEMQGVNIVLHYEHRGLATPAQIEFHPTTGPGSGRRTFHVVYRLGGPGWNHYDSLLF
jgi:hypothetical protein